MQKMEDTRKITKSGNSQAIPIPKEFLEALDLKLKDEVQLTLREGAIVIRKKKKKRSLAELVAAYPVNHKEEEIPHGDSVGDEIW